MVAIKNLFVMFGILLLCNDTRSSCMYIAYTLNLIIGFIMLYLDIMDYIRIRTYVYIRIYTYTYIQNHIMDRNCFCHVYNQKMCVSMTCIIDGFVSFEAGVTA